MYVRFWIMICTAMVAMYFVMFVGSWEFSHVRLSESRIFMAFAMGGVMALIMFFFMRDMYKNTKANMAVIITSISLIGAGIALDRSQVIVRDTDFMSAMIPHHSLAITRAERAQIEDVRVCEVAYKISESQRREIAEMNWLIEDIRQNGIAATPEAAVERPIPEFQFNPERECPDPGGDL